MKKLFVIFFLCPFPCLARSDRQWPLIPLRSAITSLIRCTKSME